MTSVENGSTPTLLRRVLCRDGAVQGHRSPDMRMVGNVDPKPMRRLVAQECATPQRGRLVRWHSTAVAFQTHALMRHKWHSRSKDGDDHGCDVRIPLPLEVYIHFSARTGSLHEGGRHLERLTRSMSGTLCAT